MIQTGFESRIKIQDIVSNQLPEFILDESPKLADFLKQYYISQEYQGGPIDIAENLDQYLKLDNLTPEVVVDSTVLGPETDYSLSETETDSILVSSTKGFPNRYGLLKIDDEIITYTSKDDRRFFGCIRGFSGITNYHSDLNENELVFSASTAESHSSGATVQNLSSLFLKEFYKKLKYTFTPGFEDRNFDSNLDVGNFIKEARSLYSSKGTDESFRILFNVLFGETPKVINLEDFLIKSSSANFIRREISIAEAISGNPKNLVGQTIFKTDDIETKASISSVEEFVRKGKKYFKLSLFVGYDDRSAIEGIFKITPSTKVLEKVEVGGSVISVDSTIGFPKSGTIRSGNNTITYTDKNVNQFLGCSGVDTIISATDNIFSSTETYFGYEDGDTEKMVELRLTGVLSKFKKISDYISVDVGQVLTVKSIGESIQNPEQNKTNKEIFGNSWIYNSSSSFEIERILGSDVILRGTVDKSQLKRGDKVEIIDRFTKEIVYPTGTSDQPYVNNDISQGSKTVSLSNFNFTEDSSKTYSLRRKINKSKSLFVPFKYGNESIISDIQNVYIDADDYAYVASNSLPSYGGGFTDSLNYEITTPLIQSVITPSSGIVTNKNDENLYTTISFDNDVRFISGERIFYDSFTPLVGLETGFYYVKVSETNKKEVKLFSSLSFLDNDESCSKFSIPVSGIGTHTFTLYSQKSQRIDSGKVLRKFPLTPNIKNGKSEKTIPGATGMLINGVEIYNYKTNDAIYYGPIESVSVLNGGNNFDVINLPKIEISAGLGTTALVTPVVSGSITEVFVDSQDFDINQILSINATGGNISGGNFEPVLVKRRREVLFDGRSTDNLGGVSLSSGQITFLTEHNFRNGQEIIYRNNGNTGISIGIGLSTLINGATYIAKVDNNTTIKIFNTSEDYQAGINTITFDSTSLSGIHKFLSGEIKNTISEIKVIDGGKVTNRGMLVKPSGISTSSDTITFKNHGFSTGDIVEYSTVVGLGTTQPQSISGLSTSKSYYILKTDSDRFKLCDAGIGATDTTNFDQQNTVRISSTGTGFQKFKYPDIQIEIVFSPVGVGTTTQTQSITATPVVKGSIESLYLYESGTGYGSKILNLESKPSFTVKTGRNAQARPIIRNGTVSNVNLQFGGFEYFSVPDVVVVDPTGAGSGAKLRASIENEKISNIEIINSGIGYSTSSRIDIIPAGSEVVFDSKIRRLRVNEVEKISPQQTEIFRDSDSGNGLQYFTTGYFENLRNTLNDTGNDVSKIIGWAYDGNPIYGSYGVSDPNDVNSGIKTLTSGYIKNASNIFDRPSTSDFSVGFFIEDYAYDGSGDLDKNNGRYEKTDDFPEGVYAYHATINPTTGDPVFPYFIGDSFRSNTLNENDTINQDFDFINSSLKRNTFPYKVSQDFADNDFIIESNEAKRQKIVVDSTFEGSVSSFEILSPGDNYKVNDSLIFDDNNTGGGISAKVSNIKGRSINKIETSYETFNNSVFVWGKNKVSVFTETFNNFSNEDYVTISGFNTALTSELNSTVKISIPSRPNIGLTTEITDSGDSTKEIYVTNIPSNVSAGNSIGIGTETLQILNIFPNKNILRVKRGLPNKSHPVGTSVTFKNYSFDINTTIDYFDSKVNKKLYFNPNESVGVGTTAGLSHNVSFTLGNEQVYRSIPTQRIYIENHNLSTNQQVTLNLNGNSNISISTSPSGTQFSLPTTLYVVNKSPNTIGIKTTLNSNEVFFTTNGSNSDDYLLETNYEQETATVEKIKSLVSISTNHNLTSGDLVSLNVKPNLSVGIGTSTAVRVIRDSESEYLHINPLEFSSSNVNSTTNEITLESHGLKTGDKVKYNADSVISGLLEDYYYVYKVNNDTIKLSDSYKNSTSNPPKTVDFSSVGGSSQKISPINPQLQSISNNNLVFDLSDSSLSGYNFKIYFDQEFNNEFISTGSTSEFSLVRVGTEGSGGSSLTITNDSNLPKSLYYSLEKSGYISTSDSEVKNYSEIIFNSSAYSGTYKISGVGGTTFTINLPQNPEKLLYVQSECDKLEYTTSSLSAKGPVDKIRIISGGSGYKNIPTFKGVTSEDGENLFVVPKSLTIGNIAKTRIINPGFEYSSDKTLQPQAFISPKTLIKDSNTIGIVTVTDGGRYFELPPKIVVINKDTREKNDTGIIRPVLSGNAISSLDIEVSPKGLSDESVEIFTTNNTNGISIKKVTSNSSTEFVCVLTTPDDGFVIDPFQIGDQVFIEGIQKSGTDGDGFNSTDLGYKFFTVSNYQDKFTSGLLDDQVTINVSEFTTNTGIAKTIQDSSGLIVHRDNYPSFEVTIVPSFFEIGEKLTSNGELIDLEISDYTTPSSIKFFGSYDLSKDEVIVGRDSGNIATIAELENYYGSFETDYSSEMEEGWDTNTGKLNEDYQVTPDNDYYQNLSYSIKSGQQWKDIRTPVNSLVHTIGTKNFSDTELISDSEDRVGITSSFNQTTIKKEFISQNRVDEISNFDLVTDVDVINDGSRFLKLKSKRLTNYTEINTNQVLKIDDISDQFSNSESDPKVFVNLVDLSQDPEPYASYLVKISDEDQSEIQLTSLSIINDTFTQNKFILEKESLSNVGTSSTHGLNEEYGDLKLEEDVFGVTFLRFYPNDPFDTEYNIKILKNKFTSGLSTGIGTTSIGFVDLISSSKNVITQDTVNIVGLSTNIVTSLFVTANVIQETTNNINVVELYVNYDQNTDDVNFSEVYIDGSSLSRSLDPIGFFTCYVSQSSNLLNIDYVNSTQFDATIKSKIIGIGDTSVGIGTYRYIMPNQPEGNERTAIYQSNSSQNTGASPVDIITLDKNNFDSFRSFIEITHQGSDVVKSLHKVLVVQDTTNIYAKQSYLMYVDENDVSEYNSISGFGTFGGEYSGDDFILKFYPDSSFTSQIKINAFSECFYSQSDYLNQPPSYLYGKSIETFDNIAYFAVNGSRINKKNFVLRNNGIPIFAKSFDPNSTSLTANTGVFDIDNHFFSEDEELIYTPRSTFVGVAASAMVYKNGSIEEALPSSVFVVNKTKDTFQISTTRSGTAVTFTSLGTGNAHRFQMAKSNEKSLITLDDLAQYPLIFTNKQSSLSGNGGSISAEDSVLSLSGISTINPGDILKIDEEYLGVINVGFGTTNVGPVSGLGTEKLITVDRGIVGSSSTSHTDGTIADVYKGSYNIVGDEIIFTNPPRGNITITRTENNLKFETTSFGGRVYLRQDYDSNKIFDDISNEFNGIGRTFTLTVGGANTIGIGTTGGNGIVFINGIFQTPTTENNPAKNFSILEQSSPTGITSISFSGIRTDAGDPDSVFTSESDVNQNQIPRGGIIVSLGSTGGLGYAPLAGAAVTAEVSAGAIIGVNTGITGGTFGSGYNGLVSIGVSVYEEGHTGSVASISATVGVGGTLIFNVADGGSGYSDPQIFVSPPSYENLEIVGISRIGIGSTTESGVGLLVSVEVGASSTTGIGSTYFEVTDFKISRQGYSFKKGDKFKPVGLVTDGRLSSPLSELQFTVLETFSDNFASWQFGELDFIDSVKNYQDGRRLRFPLFYNGSILSFEVDEENDADIDLANSLLIIINGVIQEPGVAYQFSGGTSVVFSNAPKTEDDVAIFFYRGTRGLDDTFVDNIIPTLEKGDFVQVFKNDTIPGTVSQERRTIYDLTFSDKFETNPYYNEGIDSINEKPITWTKQKVDKFVNGEILSKKRQSILSQVYPTVKVISDISNSDTEIFVDDADLFGYDLSEPYQFKAILVDEKETTTGIVTSTIDAGGTISSVSIIDGGSGYSGSSVQVKFAAPIVTGTGIGTVASATVTVSASGTLTTPITITNPGFGYTTIPKAIVPAPNTNFESITKIESIRGFSGIVTSIESTTNGSQKAIKFTLDRGSTFGSHLQVGYPILIKNTHVGSGVISVDSGDSSVIGIGTTFLDNIYYVHDLTVDGDVGIVTCNVSSSSDITGINSTGDYVGEFSWGLMRTITRGSSPISIGVTGKTVNSGLTTFPTIQRRSEGLRQTGSLPEKID